MEKRNKKKILLLSDDLRMQSGIGTISRLFVQHTLEIYDWVQVGAAIEHPEQGNRVDLTEHCKTEWGIDDPSLIIYPQSGYGSQDLIRHLMMVEQPDAILHFTDPRFWDWLYHMEHEIREHIPLLFYHIWDDLPYPMYNRTFYESCDWIGCISKQTYNIVKNVWGSDRQESWTQPEDWQVKYVPHGIDSEEYYPIDDSDPDFQEFKNDFFSTIEFDPEDIDFVVFWSNRNIRRKMPGDVILGYKTFCDSLPPEKAERCLLVLHTAPIDPNGTDLIAVKEEICPDYKIAFSPNKLDTDKLNYLFNFADVTVNIASNEGFGLTSCESLMAGTPIVVNVTGGLQDQCGFENDDGKLIGPEDFTYEHGSNHDGRYKNCGIWAKPVFPTNRALVGSPATPYIFDDRASWQDLSEQLRAWYDTPSEERRAAGLAGREYCLTDYPNGGGLTAKNMAKQLSDGIEETFEHWTPRKRINLYTV